MWTRGYDHAQVPLEQAGRPLCLVLRLCSAAARVCMCAALFASIELGDCACSTVVATATTASCFGAWLARQLRLRDTSVGVCRAVDLVFNACGALVWRHCHT